MRSSSLGIAAALLFLSACSADESAADPCAGKELGARCNDGLCYNGAADGTCDRDGVCRTAPADTGDCVVFLTSDEHAGDLGGLAGADAICQRRARAAGLEGTFKAWLSDSKTSAAERLTHASVPYIDTKGRRIADGWSDLADGGLQRPICIDETGWDWDEDAGHCGIMAWMVSTWTGTSAGGDAVGPFCSDWTDDSEAVGALGHVGYYCYADGDWTDDGSAKACWVERSLYCFQQ